MHLANEEYVLRMMNLKKIRDVVWRIGRTPKTHTDFLERCRLLDNHEFVLTRALVCMYIFIFLYRY